MSIYIYIYIYIFKVCRSYGFGRGTGLSAKEKIFMSEIFISENTTIKKSNSLLKKYIWNKLNKKQQLEH